MRYCLKTYTVAREKGANISVYFVSFYSITVDVVKLFLKKLYYLKITILRFGDEF